MLIGFIGAPSCGKSTTAFGLCSKLKQEGYPVEFIAEYARRYIMECRRDGIVYKGGFEGQTVIYGQDNANALFYREHSDAISIMDGSTINCYFYGYEILDLAEEAVKYDLLFYTPVTDIPPTNKDLNRVQNKTEILELAQRWEDKIRPLMKQIPHIVELPGYPFATVDEMVDHAYTIIGERFLRQRLAA
jgi:GTPase SAR1 family protein